MNDAFNNRWNQIIPRITSEDFLKSRGLGNEIAFYIFDYPPEQEKEIRQRLNSLEDTLIKKHKHIRFTKINLFEAIIRYLDERKLLEQAKKLQREKGSEALLKALRGPLHESKVAEALVKYANPDENDFIIMTGIGQAWPLIRTHTLLNALQSTLKSTPLVVFYPGNYDGLSFKLFNRAGSDSYYRAFRLIS